jgi:exonuclease III
VKKNGLEFFEREKPDIICLQEIKCSKDKLPNEVKVRKMPIYAFYRNELVFITPTDSLY